MTTPPLVLLDTSVQKHAIHGREIMRRPAGALAWNIVTETPHGAYSLNLQVYLRCVCLAEHRTPTARVRSRHRVAPEVGIEVGALWGVWAQTELSDDVAVGLASATAEIPVGDAGASTRSSARIRRLTLLVLRE